MHLRVEEKRKEAFGKMFGEIGKEWAIKYKNDPEAVPSLEDVIEEIMRFLER